MATSNQAASSVTVALVCPNARHEAGALRVVEARASDFVGAGVVDGGHLAKTVVPRLLAGKTVHVIPAADQPHSFTDVADVGRALAVLGSEPRAWGRAWHVPTAPAVTPREAVHALCAAAGVEPVAVRTVPRAVLRAAGLVVPFARELDEVRHSFTAPYVLDSSAFTRAFGVEATLEQTWTDTVAWWRSRQTVAA
ncbi:MAG: NAD-dependent epimerase/dehydratase [Frankiales bacterium]|nr:NAD-dependent epimerase/dehydratase [Frankiales bacterium]